MRPSVSLVSPKWIKTKHARSAHHVGVTGVTFFLSFHITGFTRCPASANHPARHTSHHVRCVVRLPCTRCTASVRQLPSATRTDDFRGRSTYQYWWPGIQNRTLQVCQLVLNLLLVFPLNRHLSKDHDRSRGCYIHGECLTWAKINPIDFNDSHIFSTRCGPFWWSNINQH